jgi:hypothetical protein
MDANEFKARRVFGTLALAVFVITWVLLCFGNLYFIQGAIKKQGFGPVDVAKRVTSPDGSMMAILARSYAALPALNFWLIISDDNYVDIKTPGNARFYTEQGGWSQAGLAHAGEPLWYSHDFELTTRWDWNEELVWSQDSLVIGVRVKGEFVYAYDFSANQGYEDAQQIRELLAAHNGIP